MLNSLVLYFVLFVCLRPVVLFSKEFLVLPDEYSSSGGEAMALAGGGSVGVRGIDSVVLNPAMLGKAYGYSVNASYHWPRFGRSFFQVGVVDTVTSSVAAGVLYNRSLTKYQADEEVNREQHLLDTPINHRLQLAFAKSFSKIVLGLNLHYVQGHIPLREKEEEALNVFGVGLGVAMDLSSEFVAGLSINHFGQGKIGYFAPRKIQGGISYFLPSFPLRLNVDYIRRTRVDLEKRYFFLPEGEDTWLFKDEERKSEQSIVFSGDVVFKNFIKFLAGYRRTFEEKKQSFATGVALTNQFYRIAYIMRWPNIKNKTETHQAIMLNVYLKM